MLQIHGGLWRLVDAPQWNRLHLGFPPGGPQDRFSCQLANRLLGNANYAGALEFTLLPHTISVGNDCRAVFGGADCEVRIDGALVPDWEVVQLNSGSTVELRIGERGCRVYAGVAGGLCVAAECGDSTVEFAGDPLAARLGRKRIATSATRWFPALGELRVLRGPEFSPQIERVLVENRWSVGLQSSGMGLRLSGPPLPLPAFDITSSTVQDGTIQATQNGLLVLLRDRGTLGGYPRVATVIDCDVDRLAQFRPHNSVQLRFVEHDAAVALDELQTECLEKAVGP